MAGPSLVIEVSGEVDFDSRNPILVEDGGKRWRLENAGSVFIGDRVTVAATKEDFTTLLVRAVTQQEYVPYHRHH